jgi:hypothetical protein
MECPVFTKHLDGRVTVDRWTPHITITKELLVEADGHLLHRDRDLITIMVSNGHASYRVTEEREREVDAALEGAWWLEPVVVA